MTGHDTGEDSSTMCGVYHSDHKTNWKSPSFPHQIYEKSIRTNATLRLGMIIILIMLLLQSCWLVLLQ